MHPTLLVSAPNSVNTGERHSRSSLQLRVADRVYDSVTIERRARKTLLRLRLTFAHLAFINALAKRRRDFGTRSS